MTSLEIREKATETHKHCSWCGGFKHRDEFAPDARGLLGRAPQCRPCWREYTNTRNQRPAVKAKRKKFEQNPERKERVRRAYIVRKYGVEALEIEKRRLRGDGCDVCGSTQNTAIDHCHKTGKVRGLLCGHCNTVLGKVNDDPKLLRKLAKYVG